MKTDKQIEEVVECLVNAHHEMDVAWTNYFIDSKKFPKPKPEHLILAEALYNAGYRKASDVAREIFEELKKIGVVTKVCCQGKMVYDIADKFDELKKKCESSNSWEELTHTCQAEIPHTIESIADLAFPESEEDE